MADHVLRVELEGGDWAELTERPTHAQVNRLYKAWQTNSADPSTYLDIMSEVVLSLMEAWSVRGNDGHELPMTPEGVAAAPYHVIHTIFRSAEQLSARVLPDPNA